MRSPVVLGYPHGKDLALRRALLYRQVGLSSRLMMHRLTSSTQKRSFQQQMLAGRPTDSLWCCRAISISVWHIRWLKHRSSTGEG